MLGILVAGRLAQTDFQQIGENQFLINVPDADNINHIVVFLTGIVPFPDGMGGAVYFSWPDPSAPPNWQFLGYISNVKPSAIFKISTLKKNHEFENSNVGIFGIGKISHMAQIGVSVEPLAVIEQQAATLATIMTNNSIEFAEKMLTNFMNYVTSFLVTQAQVVLNPTENFVPLSSVQGWYETFQRRLQQNPKFWKNM
ncbi:PREDICTED: protein OPI10 homolog [Dinoponera quadriceps]|uniref:Protein OPI10 homolog n=1 Tax=Dinoponera quadriceps TaxID=609295 RepID=A0A6P3YDK8_DINQU|nr:PREDICTED: protein OPI10 homolog [Dinoponera quadriceps]